VRVSPSPFAGMGLPLPMIKISVAVEIIFSKLHANQGRSRLGDAVPH
jgi:hypothetical protein